MKTVMTAGLTAEQQRQFDEDGFFLVEDFLSESEINDLINVTNNFYNEACNSHNLGPHDPFQIRNMVAAHPLYRGLIDHPKILPLVVDTVGFNSQIRTSHVDIRPPMQAEFAQAELGALDSFFPWHSDGPNYGWPRVEGTIPFMEIKVALYLTDLTAHNSGAICVVRGSHKESPWIERKGEKIADPDRIVEVNVKPGTAMIWRTALLHCVTPNLSTRTRKCIYLGYCHRWLRPSDYDHQPPEALADATPIQLQLLGELGTGKTNYNGDDPMHPASRYWRPHEEDIPLKAWAEERGWDGSMPWNE